MRAAARPARAAASPSYSLGSILGWFCAASALASAALGSPIRQATPGVDPFSPGLRWLRPATPTDPWIPGDVTFAGSGNLVWSAAAGPQGLWSLIEVPGASPTGPRTPRSEHRAPQAPIASIQSVAAERAEAFYGLRQETVTGFDKRTEVAAYQPYGLPAAAPLDPLWRFDFGLTTTGPARLATDAAGELVIAALLDAAADQVEIVGLNGADGAVLFRHSLAGSALNALCVARDGGIFAVAAGLDVYAFRSDGTQLDHFVRSAATPALALSSSGRVLVAGGDARLDVRVRGRAGYRPARSVPFVAGVPVELALRAALSESGERVAIAWWDRTSGVALRLEVWDLRRNARLLEFSQSGPVGGLQNVPEALVLSAQGDRVALGTWGLGGPEPEVMLFDVDSAQLVFEANLPGSVHELDLDATGTRIVVAHKDTHANQFSSTGGIRLYDTGERDVVLLEAPRAGRELRVAARRSGAGAALFLVGSRASVARPLPGTGGMLALELQGLRVFSRTTDGAGQAEWAVDVPHGNAWVGFPFAVQSAFRVAGATDLSAAVLDPLVLLP